jgi:flagellar hook protein FlgE
MSLNSTMYTGLSGLSAMTSSINVTSDNIANMNSVGHRASRAQFSDVLSKSIMGVGQVGGGVKLAKIEKLFQQGAVIGSARSTDMAISGRGFFVVRGSQNGVTDNFYTRAGQFNTDAQGYLVNPDGLRVQGYMTDANQVLSSSLSDLRINSGPLLPNPTTRVALDAQLNGHPSVTGQNFLPADPANTSNWSTTTSVFDSIGNSHQATVYFTRSPTNPNEWTWNAMVDGSETATGVAGTPFSIADGTMTFNNGLMTGQTTNNNTVDFIGAAPGQTIDFDFTGTSARAHSTQDVGGGFDIRDLSQDGFGAANLAELGVGENGDLIARYDNGLSRLVGRVALADFRNESGLERAGGSVFAGTPESGDPLIGFAGAGGRGDIRGSSLEQSNVDLSTEFVKMIADQRAYQAASRTITTADELMSETVNLKR